MEVGIIGKGKMGRDVFNHLFQFDDKLVLICRKLQDVEEITSSVEKQLKKMLKRGYITNSEYEEKMQSFLVSNDLSALKNCDLVIESIFEEKELKQDIFERVESIVKPECILASNTSSIPLNIVFEKCKIKERCLGMHFFFPVKVTRTVEVSKTRFTEQKYVEVVKELVKKIDKTPLELKEEANMILSKMLLNMISQNYIIYEENYLTMEEIDKALKENLFTFGLFEIIDSTGINIVLESRENFNSHRYMNLYTPFYNRGKKLLEEGYPGGVGNKGLIAYEQEHPVTLKKVDEAELEDYKQNIVLRLQSLLINELAFLINNEYVEKDQMNEAVKEALGLSEDPISMLKRIGNQKIIDCLLDSYEKSQDDLYKPEDLSVLNN
ncbi:3-hydroxyacyl-CoA dehydrogenase family protein [Clostridium sp. DJ247]|uniref:3-hydroxyacyl-CoA dehydrogenase family protein n=1 Tax=Clostridium sp. DJ247 TaxID=2726188 RepID=UPI0016265CD1|nr:3-hydroxyacyl-CoA dehydrogenase family protein [Clostridium sp. DJ247]MBC2581428.1 3-hydroxyacyl-CoA dehydrogenase family protein [Clostridium sp. DJ247]